ncbi:MAG: RNA polymerase sigma factor [Verrucomicrobia bacterium]|nr:RNA polymerase sigma factor [Verrucomicrobiota bacterium]
MPKKRRAHFPVLYAATITPLRRYLARLLGSHDDAQDIAHDAYARVYKAMDTKWPDRPEAFLFTTARHLALNQIKRRQIAPVQNTDLSNIIEFTPATTPGVEHLVMAREEWLRLEAAIARLPAGCRQVLLLRKVEQLTHAEIATTLGIAISTVEKQHARALRLLRAALQDPSQNNCKNHSEADGEAAAR